MQEMLFSSVVLYAPCCTVLGAEHVVLQEAGQDTQYIPCTVLGTAKGAGWTEASSFAWLGKPFAEAFVDSDCPFAMQELASSWLAL